MSAIAELKMAAKTINSMPSEEFYAKFIELAKSYSFSTLLGDVSLLQKEEKEMLKEEMIKRGVPKDTINDDESLYIIGKIIASRIMKVGLS